MEMSLEEIEKMPILDKDTAITSLDDVDLFETMLMGFEEMSMRNNLTDLKIALEKLDYYSIRLSSHSLKGASSYLHAERVKTASSMIQFAVDNQKPEQIFKYYPILIKQCILLKRRIRYEACIKEGKPFKDDESDFDIAVAKYYKIIKRSHNDFDVIQISKPNQLPPVPKYDFKHPGKVEPMPDQVDSKILQGDTKEQLSAHPKEATENASKSIHDRKPRAQDSTKKSQLEEAKIQSREKETIKIDEAPKSTGCSCAIL